MFHRCAQAAVGTGEEPEETDGRIEGISESIGGEINTVVTEFDDRGRVLVIVEPTAGCGLPCLKKFGFPGDGDEGRCLIRISHGKEL